MIIYKKKFKFTLLTFNLTQDNEKLWQSEAKTMFGVLSMVFENKFLYSYSATLLTMSKIIYRKNLKFMLSSFNASQDNGKIWQSETQTTFGCLSTVFENRFLCTYSATFLVISKIFFGKNIFGINCREINNKLS